MQHSSKQRQQRHRAPNRLFKVVLASLLYTIAGLPATQGSALAQDFAAGGKAWLKCRACHQLGEAAKSTIGPHLNGVIGRRSGTVEGYSYSAGLQASGVIWDEASFSRYVQDPRAALPGTKMVFAGIKNGQEINDLIAYLKQFKADGQKGP